MVDVPDRDSKHQHRKSKVQRAYKEKRKSI